MSHDLTAIDPRAPDSAGWHVVVETPRESGAKYDYEPDFRAFRLAYVLPEGSVFPYPFGFIPSTLGDDGDPLDVLLLSEESTFCGCVIASRVVGVIEGIQRKKDGAKERNDRFLAVPVASRRFAGLRSIKDLPAKQREDLSRFFEDYNEILHREFDVIRWAGPSTATKLVEKGLRKYRRAAKHR
ncbi:MAG: inorganic diphosphatase [Gemmatimonadales bacterium]